MARERMKELETDLYKSQKNNYNRLLKIYPEIDSNYSKSVKDRLDKIIKNSSLPIQWHKYSKWVDESYLLVGKCRYYDVDWENAITTFRYVISRYDDEETKNLARIWLMRVYMEQNQWDQARQQADILAEEYLSINNMAQFSLASGHYHIKNNEFDYAYEKIKIGAKYVKPKDYRAKIYYLLGQLAQKQKKDKEAYEHYRRCAKQRPEYEMWFYAKMNMYQLKELKNEKEADKTLKFYKKLLKDIKNEDYRDRIYYQMGLFEEKREHWDEAIKYHKESLKQKKTNPFNKAVAYLHTADLYYDKKQDFENASIYYDSTITVLEKDLEEYPRAYRRQRILKEFVDNLKVVRTEDSLQRLAKMDPKELDKLIEKWIAEEEKRRIEEEKAAQKAARLAELNAANAGLAGSGNIQGLADATNKWYFYNPTVMETGKNEFIRKWGNRPLEDHWRRSNKERDDPSVLQAANNAANSSTNSSPNTPDGESNVKVDVAAEKKKYYDAIPFDKVALDSSNARLKKALFRMAQIYDFSLEEYPNARKTYERFVNDFHEDPKVPEALYALYIICKQKLSDSVCQQKNANMLFNEFPNSLYAKLIKNPNYLVENRLLGEKIKYEYRMAFSLYEQERYLQAFNTIVAVMKEHPDNEYEDRFKLLLAMLVGRTQSLKNYKDSLNSFIKTYQKTSNLVPYAKDLLAKADNLFKQDSIRFAKSKVIYNLDLNLPHCFAIEVHRKSLLDSLSANFTAYHRDFYADQNLKIITEKLADNSYLLVVKSFVNSIQALNYYRRQQGKSSPVSSIAQSEFEPFVITDKNLDILVKAQDYKSYREFFNRNYLKK